jgi:hypothetical protein
MTKISCSVVGCKYPNSRFIRLDDVPKGVIQQLKKNSSHLPSNFILRDFIGVDSITTGMWFCVGSTIHLRIKPAVRNLDWQSHTKILDKIAFCLNPEQILKLNLYNDDEEKISNQFIEVGRSSNNEGYAHSEINFKNLCKSCGKDIIGTKDSKFISIDSDDYHIDLYSIESSCCFDDLKKLALAQDQSVELGYTGLALSKGKLYNTRESNYDFTSQ